MPREPKTKIQRVTVNFGFERDKQQKANYQDACNLVYKLVHESLTKNPPGEDRGREVEAAGACI